MIRNIFAAAITAGVLAAAPAFAAPPFVEDDGNGGLRIVRTEPSPNVVGGAVTTVRPGGEAGSLEVVTVRPVASQDGRSVTAIQGIGAAELRIVPLAEGRGAAVGG